MKRMYSKEELLLLISNAWPQIVGALKGHDIEVEGITSKGIANTGAFANIGDVVVAGDITAQGEGKGIISGNKITGNEIVEIMSGYSYTKNSAPEAFVFDHIYVGIVKNGNKITFVQFCSIKRVDDYSGSDYLSLGLLAIPSSVGEKLYPYTISSQPAVANLNVPLFSSTQTTSNVKAVVINKNSDTQLQTYLYGITALTLNQEYIFRVEATFLLSENLASQEE